MNKAADWTGPRAAGMGVIALVAGALLAGLRSSARQGPVPPRAPREDLAFAAPVLRGQRAAPPLPARLLDGFKRTPKPLPDSLFGDAFDSGGGAAFVDIAAPLSAPGTQVRVLGRPEGSYLRDRARGWLAFQGQRWVPVARAAVPDSVTRAWPDPDPQALHREPASRDGEVDVR